MGINPVMQDIANQLLRLNRGERDGTITRAEAEPLRARLEQLETAASCDVFEPGGGAGLQRLMVRGVGRSISAAAANATVDPQRLTGYVATHIEVGLRDGSLTAAEAVQLRNQAAQARTPAELAALVTSLKAERHDDEMNVGLRLQNVARRTLAGALDGSLTGGEALALASRLELLGSSPDPRALNALSADLFRHRHDAAVDPSLSTGSLAARIDGLVRRGRISAEQAHGFAARLVQLSALDPATAGPRLNVLEQQLEALAL